MKISHVIGVAAAIIVLLLTISAGIYSLWLRDASVVLENHLVEWTQAGLLLAAALVHALRTRSAHEAWPQFDTEKCPAPAPAGDGPLRLTAALFCLSLAVREVDIDKLGDSDSLETVELIVRGVVIAAWLVLVWRVRDVIPVWWNRRKEIILSGGVVLTASGCMLYASSWPLDKFPEIFGRLSMLIEETVQLNATLLMFIAACWPVQAATAEG